MGKRVGLLAGMLVLSLGSGVVAQSPSPEPPSWFGGRVEMPEHGFAVTLPDDWVAFDLGGDLDEQAKYLDLDASTDETRASAEILEDVRQDGALLWLLDVSGFGEGCMVWVQSDATRPFNEEFADSLYETLLGNESVARVESPTSVDLPVGSGYVFAMAQQSRSDPDSWGQLVSYLVVGDGGTFRVSCTAPERPADRWLSIVETFEFLPAEV